jgi:hypothetical protein
MTMPPIQASQQPPTQPDDLDLLLQQMAQMGISPEVLGLAGNQINRGQEMQDTPMAQGRNVGSTYVASNPLEHLATAVRQYQGGKMAKQATGDYGAQLGANRTGIAAFGKAQSGQLQQIIDEIRKRQQTPPVAPGYADSNDW